MFVLVGNQIVTTTKLLSLSPHCVVTLVRKNSCFLSYKHVDREHALKRHLKKNVNFMFIISSTTPGFSFSLPQPAELRAAWSGSGYTVGSISLCLPPSLSLSVILCISLSRSATSGLLALPRGGQLLLSPVQALLCPGTPMVEPTYP